MKKLFLLFIILFTVSCSKKDERPNILFIMSINYVRQAWGIYGSILKDYAQNKDIKILGNKGVF